MQLDGFEWDEGNITKCQKHGVTIEEIEEALATIEFVVDDPFEDEKRYRTVGKTRAGRHVFAVFMIRDGKLRPISVRYMHEKEVKLYEEEMARTQNR